MSTVSTHVLDTAEGRPASGVPIRLENRDGVPLGDAVTDADGRVSNLCSTSLEPGDYVLRFDTASYVAGFYPEVVIVFHIAGSDQHYHVPLLISPYGYSTYRGS